MSTLYSSGKVTAYGAAVEAGYTGTYEQFCQANADLPVEVATLQGMSATASTLAAGASATASYNHSTGVLTLGIPQGIPGNIANLASEFSASASYAVGDYVIYDSQLYKCITAHTGAWNASDFEAVTVGSELSDLGENKANVDGSYEQMTVGNAEQLVSTVGIEDATPYNFRTSGGSVDIGNREQVNAVVGGTVAWNQLVQNGDFSGGLNSWGSITGSTYQSQSVDDGVCTITVLERNGSIGLSNTNSKIPSLANHKILFSVDINPSAASTIRIGAQNASAGNYGVASVPQAISANTWTHYAAIGVVADGNTGSNLLIYPNSGGYLAVNDTIQLKNIAAFDLTAMFGSTVADYIYSLEQANAGAGVAYFRKLFPKDYYEYNAGELLSVNTSQHKMVGFNQWDEEWELGDLSSSTGGNIAQTDRIRAKNYIPVLSGNTYYLNNGPKANISFFWYDADKKFLTNYSMGTSAGQTFNPPAGAAYLRFVVPGITTYNHDICINLSWSGSRDGEYEPYEEWVYPLDDSLTLRGIPKLDENGNLYYDGDRYLPDGTVERRYGVVDLGTLTWTYNTSQGRFVVNITEAKVPSNNATKANLVCAKYETATTNATIDSSKDKVIGLSVYATLGIKDTGAGADAAAFKASLSGVYLVYELATPTTETATPYTQIQSVDDFGTEEYTDAAVAAGTRDVSVPVGSETYYFANLRDKLQHLPDLAGADGDYIVRQTGTNMTLVPYADVHELPDAPTEDGTYTLQVTVANGTATLSWV